ncbi:hypothetical protein AMECASPLE_018427 [Ameca splendens]|uniref:Uncharacterized protein n=1 Tax=Ameca splendens TaxID=208324 RepID=A0ABV0YPM8_9TELE
MIYSPHWANLEGTVGCRCAAPREHSGAKGLAQGPRVAICGIRTRPLVSPPERKPPVLTTRPPLLLLLQLFPALSSFKQWQHMTHCWGNFDHGGF